MKKRLLKRTLISTRIVLLLILIIWTVWCNSALMISKSTVSSSHIPSAFNGFRIAQVSDLYNAVFGKDNAELLQALSECEPNIIVITGDLVDVEYTDIDIALDFAKGATQIASTYYVTGNHEASLPQYDELKIGLELNGVVVLEDILTGLMSILWTKKVERLCSFFEFLILLLLGCYVTNSAMYSFAVIPALYIFKDCSAGIP